MKRNSTDFARHLRNQSTDAERLFWSRVRAHRLFGYKFKRQQPIGDYVVDFLCAQSNLIVELDGGQHANSESDVVRDDWLRSQGFRVVRFWNIDVLTNLNGVLEEVVKHLRTPLPNPLPRGERE